MRRIDICLWASLLVWPGVASAQDSGMFGYCHVQVGNDTWISPVFEHPGINSVGKVAGQDQDGFRQAVQSEVDVPQSAQVKCGYSRDQASMDQAQKELQDTERGSVAGGHLREIAWAPPVPAPRASGPLVADEVPAALRAMLAADPFFAVPKGNGGAIERVDERTVGSGGDVLTVTQKARAQQDGNLCRENLQIAMLHGEEHFTVDGVGQSWAGLVPLTTVSRTSNGQGAQDSRQQALSLRHEGDALFPLRQGAHTVLTLEAQVRDDDDDTVSRDLRLDCRVGATVSASAVVAKASGKATELRCSSTQPSAPKGPAQNVLYHWFADAGCFVNAPIPL